MKLERKKRQFVDENLVIDAWEVIKPYFEDLLSRDISQKSAFDKWLSDRSELEAVLEEDAAWRYIRMTIDTRDEELSNAYSFFITKIQPELAPFDDLLNKKLAASPFFDPNTSVQEKRIFFRSVQTALELFREENIPLEAELSELAQQYGSISAAQTITYKGETLTMQKASLFLKETDESVRQEVFEKICDRRRQDIEQLDKLYTELILKRQQLAQNAGFANFRDYKFKSLGRFDYTKEDCFQFHKAIREHIVPLVKAIQQEKLNKLGKAQFKPWDLEVDPEGKSPLKPFEGGDQLLEGTLEMFKKLDPYFADCLSTMKSMGHLDLDSKAGKSPGGYNYPLYEIGVPFIFMNSVGSVMSQAMHKCVCGFKI